MTATASSAVHAPVGAADARPVLSASGEMHIEDEHVDMRQYRLEDWLAFALFWVLAAVVFLQFFSRYALNDSVSWTEEIARYLLVALVFVGAAVPVRRNNHIHVDFLYRLVPRWMGRVLATLVDAVRISFLACCTVLTVMLMQRIGGSPMAVVDLPVGIVYGAVLAGFALMTWRAVGVARANWRDRSSALEDPGLPAEAP